MEAQRFSLVSPLSPPPCSVTPSWCLILGDAVPRGVSAEIKQPEHAGSESEDRKPIRMITSLFISSVVLAAFLAPGLCQKIKVCREEDGEVRVDCLIQPKPNTINTFEFSMFKGGKETVIITNVTGITADQSYKGKTRVEQLEPHGYRLTLVDVP
ncbi:hypothetical protein AGOR_G00030670 [Albula goreensis]|uniref:Uncharacterized protein n=1 Tax=Albula goreensis TaxID=1534307 RepID=A0A8T3E3G5_9TELE|nr:hypothetical protein AGOR_G00030670 [Albula goreensis]